MSCFQQKRRRNWKAQSKSNYTETFVIKVKCAVASFLWTWNLWTRICNKHIQNLKIIYTVPSPQGALVGLTPQTKLQARPKLKYEA